MSTSAQPRMEMSFPSLPPLRDFVLWCCFCRCLWAGRSSCSLPFPGFPCLAAPLPAVQPLVASIEPSPALDALSEAFFTAGCAVGLQPFTALCLCSRSNAVEQLHVQMNPELISATGYSWPWWREDISGWLACYCALWKKVGWEESLAGCTSGRS